jgi:hypothetical protein
VSRPVVSPADVEEAWNEVARLRGRALAAQREAAERRRQAAVFTGGPFHPRGQGLGAAAEFHEARAGEAAERAAIAALRAEALELRLRPGGGASRCA